MSNVKGLIHSIKQRLLNWIKKIKSNYMLVIRDAYLKIRTENGWKQRLKNKMIYQNMINQKVFCIF